jgi:hypothetical protein
MTAQFPVLTTPPAYYRITSINNWGHSFYEGDTIALTFLNAGLDTVTAFTGNYYVRDNYGNEVTRGTLTGQTTLTLNTLPLGWYKLYLTQAVNDTVYGYSAGGGTFSVIPRDSRLPDPAALASTYASGADPVMWMNGATWAGPSRPGSVQLASTDNPTYRDASLDVESSYWWLAPAFQDTAHPHREIIAFVSPFNETAPNPASITTIVEAAIARYGVDKLIFEGPCNEPDYDGIGMAANMRVFYNAVKAANPAALVAGPCMVSVNGVNIDRFQVFCEHAATDPDGIPLDVVTFHNYNDINGDISLGRKTLDAFVAVLETYGMAGLPRWQTESGAICAEAGYFNGRVQTQWIFLERLLLDQYAIPYEHSQIYTSWSNGNWAYPSFFTDQSYHWFQIGPMLRHYASEVFGKTFETALDFGTPGNDMIVANQYAGTDGTAVIVLVTSGIPDTTVRFQIEGASTVTTVDCFGNETANGVAGAGIVEVSASIDPSYLRLPAGATATLLDKWTLSILGPNLATTATVSTSGSVANQTNAARMVNGIQENGYYDTIFDPNNASNPYIDDTFYPQPIADSNCLALGAHMWALDGQDSGPQFIPQNVTGTNHYAAWANQWRISTSSLQLAVADSPLFETTLPNPTDTAWCATAVAIKSAPASNAAVVQAVTSIAGTASIAATSTNSLLVVIGLGGPPTDSGGNTWVLQGQSTTGGGADISVYTTTVAHPASSTTITFPGIGFVFYEISGAANTTPIETIAVNAKNTHGLVIVGLEGAHYPAWVELDFAVPTDMDHVIVFCEPPWESYGALLDFDIQHWNGTTWVDAETVTEPGGTTSTVDNVDALTFYNVENTQGTGCTVESFYTNRWIFDIELAGKITTQKLRVYIRQATWGGVPTVEANNAMTGFVSNFQDHFTIREIQVFDATANANPIKFSAEPHRAGV